LDEFDLDNINSLENLITLCSVCHHWFDAHDLAIEPFSHVLLVSAQLRLLDDRTKFLYYNYPNAGYDTLHGKRIVYNEPLYLGEKIGAPSEKLLQHRFELFLEKHSTLNYCMKCLYFAPISLSCHPLTCRNESGCHEFLKPIIDRNAVKKE
jgi:hypothetical protein